jgi:dipeptidase E
MQKIVAIGGGSIGFGAAKPEVTPISREILRLSGKKNPRLLFIPTASADDKAYVRAVQNHFGRKLGCQVDVLYLHPQKQNPTRRHKDAKKGDVLPNPSKLGQPLAFTAISRKIHWADVIYVGGGNTLMMMNRWKRLGVDRLLRWARTAGKVLCGSSAGALCWFKLGNSDSRKYYDPQAGLIRVRGLGFIDALGCPHYNVEKDRKPQLQGMMRHTPGVAIALDNCAALEVVGDGYRILTSDTGAHAYKVYWLGGRYFQEPIPQTKAFRAFSTLIQKG